MVALLISAAGSSGSSQGRERGDVRGMRMHHIKDAHEWHILSYPDANGEKQHVSINLPVILIDNGVKVFSSKRLYHENDPVEITTPEGGEDYYFANEELGYGIFHENIYKL